MNYSELIEKGIAENKIPNLNEIKNLKQRSYGDLNAAKNILDIDREWAYIIAFFAMLRILKTLIRAEGLIPKGLDESKNTILISGSILEKDFKSLLNKLDRMRRRTENFIKEYNKPITKYESQQALLDAEEFVKKIDAIIKERHSQLLLI